MEYLILMTVAGSGLCLAYLVWEKLFHRYLTQNMRYSVMKLMLLVYVVPWVWLKNIYVNVVRWLLPVRVPVETGHPVAVAKIIVESETYVTHEYLWRLLTVTVWLAIALILLIRKSRLYFRRRQELLSIAVKCESGVVFETLQCLKEEFHFKGRVDVYLTPIDNGTFTLGAIRPMICLQKEYAEEQLYFILKHEMLHVIRKDLLLKLLLEFACCLHWFNYLVYALNDRFDDACEESCDERVLRGCTQEECKSYTRLLIRNYSMLNKVGRIRKSIPFESGLGNDFDRITERVNLIVGAKKIKGWKKRLAGGVFALLFVANSFTAFAYPDVYSVENGDGKLAADTVSGETVWTLEGHEDEFYGHEMVVEVYGEAVFVDQYGNVCAVDSCSPQRLCFHDIVKGQYQTHVKDDKGGCELTTYSAKKCTLCSTIWIGEKISTFSYTKCPH